MARVPVDYDPFAEESNSIPGQGRIPVDYDPFAEQPKAGVVSSLGRGLVEGLSTGIPEMVGSSGEFIGAKTGIEALESGGRALKEWSGEKSKEWFGEQPERSGLAEIVYEGSKMLAPSIIPGGAMVSGARAVLGVGRLARAAKLATAAGDLVRATELTAKATSAASKAMNIGSATNAVALFGTSQAQHTIDAAEQTAKQMEAAGDIEGARKAREAAEGYAPYLTGAIEAAGEYFGTKYLGKLFGLSEAEVVGRGAKELGKQFAKTLGVEIGTEVGQSGGQAAVEKTSGIRPDADPLQEAFDVVGPTAFMTLLTGGLAHAVNRSDKAAKPVEPINKEAVLGKVSSVQMDPAQLAEIKTRLAAHGITPEEIDAAHEGGATSRFEQESLRYRQEQFSKLNQAKSADEAIAAFQSGISPTNRNAEMDRLFGEYSPEAPVSFADRLFSEWEQDGIALQFSEDTRPLRRLALPAPEGVTYGEGFEMRPQESGKTIIRRAGKEPQGDYVAGAEQNPQVIYSRPFKSKNGAIASLNQRIKAGSLNGNYDVVPTKDGMWRIESMAAGQVGEAGAIKQGQERQQGLNDLVRENPVYAVVQDIRKAPLNLGQIRQDYGPETIAQISKKFPGIFSEKGTTAPDEAAEMHGYEGTDQLIEALKSAPTIKESLQKYEEPDRYESVDKLVADGLDPVFEKMPAGNLTQGDEIEVGTGSVAPADRYKVKGYENGQVVLKDGVTVKVDPWDELNIEGRKATGKDMEELPTKISDLPADPAHVAEGMDNPDNALDFFENAIPQEDRATMADVFAHIRKNGLHRQMSFAQQLFNMVGGMYSKRTGKQLAILGGNADNIGNKEAPNELTAESGRGQGASGDQGYGAERPGAGERQGVSGDDRQAGGGSAGTERAAVTDNTPPSVSTQAADQVGATAPASSQYNPFRDKAIDARAAYERLSGGTSKERAMAANFPLGVGFGRGSERSRNKAIDSSVNRAVAAVEAKKKMDLLEAQADAYDRGEITSQGRSVKSEKTAAAEKEVMRRETMLPIVNEPGGHEITREKWAKTHADYKTISVSPDGKSRYRSMIVAGALKPVFIVDMKATEQAKIETPTSPSPVTIEPHGSGIIVFGDRAQVRAKLASAGVKPKGLPNAKKGGLVFTERQAGEIRAALEDQNTPVRETQAVLSAKSETQSRVHDYSNTQINLRGEAARKIIEFGKKIPDNELYLDPKDASYGREENPHVTVRYGLDTDNPTDLAGLSSLGQIVAKMGKVSIFETDKYDVVKVEVDGDSLRAANKKVGDLVELPGETFKDYQPHATIAFVKKGEGQKYVGDESLAGTEVAASEITLTDRNNTAHAIPLKETPNAQTDTADTVAAVAEAKPGDDSGLTPQGAIKAQPSQSNEGISFTEPEARARMAWQSMGQKDGTKTTRLTFNDGDGTMTYATVESYDDGKTWKAFDRGGDMVGDARSLSEAKKLAADAAIKSLIEDGYVKQQESKNTQAEQEVAPAKAETAPAESSKPASEMTAAELLRAAADKMEGKDENDPAIRIHSTIDRTYQAQADRLRETGQPVPTIEEVHAYATKQYEKGGQRGTVMDMMNDLADKMEVADKPATDTLEAATDKPAEGDTLFSRAPEPFDNDERASERRKRVEIVEEDYRLPNIGNAVPQDYVPKEAAQKTVTIYRGIPHTVKEGTIRPGDWVSLDKKYASEHGTGESGRSKVVSMNVPADHVVWAGTDMNEWFYAPRDIESLKSKATTKTGTTVAQVETELRTFLKRGYDKLTGSGKLKIFQTEREAFDFINGKSALVELGGNAAPRSSDKGGSLGKAATFMDKANGGINGPRRLVGISAIGNPPGVNSPETESFSDTARLNIKHLANLVKTEPFASEGFGALDVPTQMEMLQFVRGVIDNQKVLNSIVKLVPVEVVDVFRREKLSPEMLLHDKAVLKYSLGLKSGANISVPVRKNSAITSAIRTVAETATKVFGPDLGMVPVDGFSANKTSGNRHGDPSFFAGSIPLDNSSRNTGVLAGEERGTAGVFLRSSGVAILVADNIKQGNAKYVATHELLHKLMFEDKLFLKQHDHIISQFEKMRRYDYRVQDAFRMVPGETPAVDVVSEGLAYFIENKANHETSLFKKIIANIRMWLMRMGIPMKNLTTDDLVAMVVQGVRKLSLNPAPLKSSDHRPVSDIKYLAKLSKSKPFSSEGYSGLDVPSKIKVLAAMSRVVDNSEVVDRIVEFVPVDMVDILKSGELSSEMDLHYMSMLENRLPSEKRSNPPITFSGGRTLSSAISAIANAVTKIQISQPIGLDRKTLSANVAGTINRHISPPGDAIVPWLRGAYNSYSLRDQWRMANQDMVADERAVGDMAPALYSKTASPSVVDDIMAAAYSTTSSEQVKRSVEKGPIFPGGFDIPEEGKATKFWDYLVFKAQDKFSPLKKVQEMAKKSRGLSELPEAEDAYLAELRYHGQAGARIEDFHDEHVAPMIEAIHKAGLTLEDVGRYLWARHAPEANAQLAKINPEMENNTALSGMSNEEAAEVLSGFGAKRADLDAIGKRVDTITKMRRDLLVESGLETAETVAVWEKAYAHYVPLHREGKGGNLPSKGRGFDTKGKEKRRTGSTRDVVNILAHVVAQYESTAIKAEKAKVGRALLEFIKNNPDPRLWEVDKVTFKPTFDKDGLVHYREDKGFVLADNVLVVKVDGEDHRITFNQENEQAKRIVGAMKNLGAEQNGILVGALSTINRWLAIVNTSANPEFIISNLLRDLQTAGYNLNATEAKNLKVAILKDVGKAWSGIRKAQGKDYSTEWAQHFREFRQAGAKTGWLEFYKDIEHREAKLQKMMESMGDGSSAKIIRGLKSVEQFIEHENTAVENAIRLSTFVHARKAGISVARAAALAKELTVNFNRKGDAGQLLNGLYLFYNASIQGTVRMFQAAKNKKVQKLMAGTVVAAAMLDMANRAMGGDDDDDEPFYDKIPDHTKERNLIIMRPGGDYFKIPLPWGYNVLHVFGQEAGKALDDNHKGYKPGKSAMRIVGSMLSSFNPIGSEASLTQMLSPTITDPIVQWAENKDWAGRPLRPENSFNQNQPESQKYWNSVREPSKWVAEKLNELTGGDEVRPGVVDISPELFDMAFDTMTGGIGRFIGDMVTTPLKLAKGEEVESYTVPLVRKVYGRQSNSENKAEFYENLDSVKLVKQQLKHYEGDPGKIKEIREEHGAEIKMISMAKLHEKTISGLKDTRRKIERSGLPDDEKKARIKKIDEQIIQAMKRFNKAYKSRVL